MDADKVNLLLVDDRPENLLALEAIIDRNDYNLVSASSGEEALTSLLKYEFAVILLDVQMPGIDGFETAKIIKAREKTKNIPIIFITSNNMDSLHIFRGYSVGAVDYIVKPFDPFILKAKVDNFVDMYRLNQKLIKQAGILDEKTKELNKAYEELSSLAAELHESEALANVINETSIDAMIIVDADGFIFKVNPSAENMFGYDKAELLGKSACMLVSCEINKSQVNHIFEALNNLEGMAENIGLKEVVLTRKNGGLFPAEIHIGKKYVKNKCIVACTIRDITKQKQDQELITHMAYYDGLTDLPNRRMFNDHLNAKIIQAKENNKPLTMMYLDMDRFKYINDSLGHHTGDRILQDIAKRLKESVREDDFVARIGGDEFNILLPETSRESGLEIAETIMDRFNSPFYLDNYEFFITTSIGISVFPYDGEDSITLMKNADAALYRAKEQGKNKVKIFHSGMNIHSYRTFILQNDLRKALERKELTLYYQPRVDLESGMIQSVEALIRWDHPNWGIILPAEFIPLAEETGQIVEIGEWVLQSACKQSMLWQEAGLAPIRVAVNFSSQQFMQKDLIEKISGLIKETGISPHLIEIEITESTVIKNELSITNVLNQIRKMGIMISIDDFGSGYSSLSYLRGFPVHTIKIDKSFIQDMSIHSQESIAFVASIISLANSLNMSIIAEGVETEDQLDILRKNNCKEIQGYLFCPPVSVEEFEEFLLKTPLKGTSKRSKKDSSSNKNHIAPAPKSKRRSADLSQELLSEAINNTKELYAISSRELDVFKLIIDGLTNKEISDQLFISEHTVKNHITHIFQKLNVTDRLQAMAKVYQICMEESQKLRGE